MLPLTQIRIGLPARNWFPLGSESGQGLALLRGMGANGLILPTRVVVQLPEGGSALRGPWLFGLKVLTDSLRHDPRVKEVRGVASLKPNMSSFQLAVFYSDPTGVRARYPKFFDAYLSADNRTTLVDVIAADSVSLTGMMDLTRRARAARRPRRARARRDAQILVGGFAAASVDLQDDLLHRFPGVVLLVLGVTALMLFVAFRSLLVPLKAVLLNCLSVGAAFGVTVLVFQHGYGGGLFGLEGPTEAIFVVVPVLVFATVFGLSMDYEVFLLTRVKEVFDKTGRNDHATMEGLSMTASTITFAAAIMIIVFGVFAFARVLAVQFLGFGLADGGAARRDPDPHDPRARRSCTSLVGGTGGPACGPREASARASARSPRVQPLQAGPHTSQCQAGLRRPVRGSLSGLYCSQSAVKPERRPSGEQAIAVGAHEMRHRLSPQPPAMKPNAAVEGEAHPLAAAREFLPGFAQLQLILPSTVAVPTGVAAPVEQIALLGRDAVRRGGRPAAARRLVDGDRHATGRLPAVERAWFVV